MQRLLKTSLLVLWCLFTGTVSLFANDEDTAYIRVVNERAAKIVAPLHMVNEAKAAEVQQVIAQQYISLNNIQAQRDSGINTAKRSIEDKALLELRVKTIQAEATEQTDDLHKQYVSKLTALLTADQLDKVKNGMTYNVLPNTYNAYMDMLPNLTEEQKKQILVWLTEAREHAMDAESSKKKHEWFGKYKGRINNYLSAAGIDMKKEGEEWQKRIKARSAQL